MRHRWRVVGLVAAVLVAAACQNQYRRQDRQAETSADRTASEGGAVDPKADPRFPGGGAASDRTGFWVDEPVETGSVSPTGFANNVVDRLSGVDQTCCGPDRQKCRGFDGRILLSLQLDAKGRVQLAELAETSIYDRPFQQCLTKEATGWRLPAPASGTPENLLIPVYVRIPDDSSPDAGR